MKTTTINFVIMVMSVLVLQSCSKDEDPIVPEKKGKPYALVTSIKNNNAYTYNYYVQSLEEINKNKNYDNTKATEVLSSDGSGIYNYDGSLFLNSYMNVKNIEKWTPNDKGIFEKTGSIGITELGSSANICFKDKNTAFIGGNASDKILIFNPSTMQKTGAIDFSSKTKVGSVTNYPNAGDKVNIVTPSEMIIRGKYMFVSFFLLEDFVTYSPASLTADILVIDLTKVNPANTDNSDAIVKWISDDRGVSLGSWNSGSGVNFMMKDEKNDIYLLSHNMWGNNRAKTGKATCVLRIKDGETDFDSSYYFDLESASRGLGSSVINLEYAGNGNFFAASTDLSAIDPDNPYSYYVDPIAQWYKFNLQSKTATKVNNQYTKGSMAAKILFEDGKAYIPYENKTESYVLEVDVNTLESKKVMNVAGTPILFKLK